MLYTDRTKEILKKALKALGKENLTLILHGASFPADKGMDTGFGTYNSEAAKKLIDWISGIFNSIQLGPAGKTKKGHPSPYAGTIFSINPLFIDLKSLTSEEWGKILSKETYEKICSENPKKGTLHDDYGYAFDKYEEALKEAFGNFDKKDGDFKKFKKQNKEWLEKDAVYEALAIEHGNDYWENWKDETDKKLFCAETDEENETAAKRLKSIKRKHSEEIDFYSFCQYIVWKQGQKTKEYALSKGIKLIADRQVAFSDRDIWANQNLFMKDRYLGCPPDAFSADGQAWGFPMVNPEKLFNEDGTIGPAGTLIKNLYKKMFTENPGGVRIDHVVGLIDPWVYRKGFKPKASEGAGRLYSSPENEDLAKYAIASLKDIRMDVPEDHEMRVKTLTDEQVDRYARFMVKLITEAAEECGLSKKEIICEDLGSQTFPVESVMEKYGFSGMRLIQFADPNNPESKYRSANVPENCWIMAGTHDSEPISMWAEGLVFTHTSYLHALNLMEDVYPYISGGLKDEIIVRLTRDAKFLAFTKMTELFASRSANVQIFFADLFGIKEVYNTPGDEKADNWTLRVPADFEGFYRENRKDGFALDLVQAVKYAMKARGDEFARKHAEIIKELDSIKE